jgi:hypothetical protein
MPKDIYAGVPQDSVLSPTFYSIYINDAPQTPGVFLGLFADYICIYMIERKDGSVLRKLQRDLSVIEMCERWNIKINEDSLRPSIFL